MKTKDFFADLLGGEQDRFVRVVKALPSDKLDYKPDPKSRTAMELATLLAEEVHHINTVLTTGEIDFTKVEPMKFSSTDAVAADLEKGFGELGKTVRGMDDATWMKDGAMKGAGEPWVMPRGVMAIHFFLDLVHHRGQLATYIRPMGGSVPSIYGPSADTAA
jgi:hypothetical protein